MPETNSMAGELESVKPQLKEPVSATESKLWKKTKEAPFVPIGVLGLLGAVTYGVVMYKRRGQMSTSVYLMKFRVIAQGMVVGAMTIGVGMSIVPDLWKRYGSKNGAGKS